MPPPPPDVSTKLPKDPEGKPSTVREKLAIHRKNPQCYGCHKAMDPMGLAFERFDGRLISAGSGKTPAEKVTHYKSLPPGFRASIRLSRPADSASSGK